jgi:hypothetical protein
MEQEEGCSILFLREERCKVDAELLSIIIVDIDRVVGERVDPFLCLPPDAKLVSATPLP